MLDPALLQRHDGQGTAIPMMQGVLRMFQAAKLARHEATAHLNLAAMMWNSHDEDDAYVHLMRARGLFAQLGDVRGLAYVCEWTGVMMQRSDAPMKAAEHLSMARMLYGLLDDQYSGKRVVSYLSE